MIEESKYCNDVMKKHLNKELVMTKEDFKNSARYWNCDNDYINTNVKLIDLSIYCLITGKYRGSANNMSMLNYIIPVHFHNLKKI